jgi:hypothetical protein
MRRCLTVCLLSIGVMAAAAPMPGDRPGPETLRRLPALVRQLDQVMQARDLPAIERAVAAVREALGPYAGVPESPERHVFPIETSTPPLDVVIRAWDQGYRGPLASAGSASALARANRMELREVAYLAYMCLAAAQAGLPAKQEYVARARTELDYLLERQAESGMFPYPADPGGSTPASVRAAAARLRQQHPELLRNGYLYVDDPAVQFDTGCCGVALSEGYRVTQDPRYLAGAENAARWAMTVPLATNWNYNAFSVWLLAHIYDLTANEDYLRAALDKTHHGVLPGLMDNGRWIDQHNAKQSYHFIIVRALANLLDYMPHDHPDRPGIQAKFDLAVDARVHEIRQKGVANIESSIWALSEVARAHAGPPLRLEALNATVHALMDQASPAASAAMLPVYIRYRAFAAPP